MRNSRIITILTAVFWVLVIIGWHLYSPRERFTLREPGADNRPDSLIRKADDVVVGEYFMKYADYSGSDLKGKWIGFRNGEMENIIRTSEPLDLNQDFETLWSVPTGEGHAAASIYNGRVYLLDYVESVSADALRCFSLETGEELWRRWYRVSLKRNHGFSRTIPAVGEDFVVTIGPNGQVMCCDPLTGDLKWELDLQKYYGSEVPFWYTGQCPLVDDGLAILAPAGPEALLLGVDCQSGEVVFTTPNTPGFTMSHSSVRKMQIQGKDMYVYIGVGGVCGVSAEKADQGKLLWSTTKWKPSVVAPSPLKLSNSRILVDAGYGVGAALLDISSAGGTWTVTVSDQYKPDKGLSSEQQTPLLYNGLLLTVLPKDGGGQRERLVAYSVDDVHTPIWTSASDERFGFGPYMILNDHLLALKDTGELCVYQISGKSLSLKKTQKLMDGEDAWGPLSYADGYLVLRDSHNLMCVKLK